MFKLLKKLIEKRTEKHYDLEISRLLNNNICLMGQGGCGKSKVLLRFKEALIKRQESFLFVGHTNEILSSFSLYKEDKPFIFSLNKNYPSHGLDIDFLFNQKDVLEKIFTNYNDVLDIVNKEIQGDECIIKNNNKSNVSWFNFCISKLNAVYFKKDMFDCIFTLISYGALVENGINGNDFLNKPLYACLLIEDSWYLKNNHNMKTCNYFLFYLLQKTLDLPKNKNNLGHILIDARSTLGDMLKLKKYTYDTNLTDRFNYKVISYYYKKNIAPVSGFNFLLFKFVEVELLKDLTTKNYMKMIDFYDMNCGEAFYFDSDLNKIFCEKLKFKYPKFVDIKLSDELIKKFFFDSKEKLKNELLLKLNANNNSTKKVVKI